jgi:hypothetical protein
MPGANISFRFYGKALAAHVIASLFKNRATANIERGPFVAVLKKYSLLLITM